MKKIIKRVLNISILTAFLVSILPSVFPNSWFIDSMSNFKLQIVIFLIIGLLFNLVTGKSKTVSLLAVLLIIWNLSFIYKLYFPNKLTETQKHQGTTIVSINLLSSNTEFKKVIDFIKSNNPDVLVLLEYNSKWETLLSAITKEYKYKKTVVRNDNFGIGYFSKIPTEITVVNFDISQVPSIKASLKIDKKPIDIIATHPFPPMGKEKFDIRNSHLKNITKQRQTFSKNLIVIGDLNTSSYSKHFIDLLASSNLKDSRNGFGILPTWPTTFTWLYTTLDHILVSDTIDVIHRDTGPNIGSDHLPIFMKFRINTL